MSIEAYLNSKGFSKFEGHSHSIQAKVEDLITLTSKPNIEIMEIGFNAGHSADCFLKNNSQLLLTSFDLGAHPYVRSAKEYIDASYPGRHTLILGNSTVTVPKYIQENKDKKFDVIFIDGGHDYPIANADVKNCMNLAHKDTIVIVDDTMHTKGWEVPWTLGPTRTWVEHLANSTILEICRKDYMPKRGGMSWGKYVRFDKN
jgi:predicted O-methyltransferase YrrM